MESSVIFYNIFCVLSIVSYVFIPGLFILVLIFPLTFDYLYIFLFVVYLSILYLNPWSSNLFFAGCVFAVSRWYFASLSGSMVVRTLIPVGGNGVLLTTLILSGGEIHMAVGSLMIKEDGSVRIFVGYASGSDMTVDSSIVSV